MAPQYKLTYFNIRGLGELPRLLMKYGGIDFEDERLEREQWPALKPTAPFGQLPLLTIGDKKFGQSLAIARYLARKVKLTGANELEDLEIDCVVDCFNDLRLKFTAYWTESDPVAKEAKKEAYIKESIPFYLTRLEAIAKANDGHLACKKLTWADFYFAALVDMLCSFAGIDLPATYPALAAVKEHVVSLPAIKSWIETRPKTDY